MLPSFLPHSAMGAPSLGPAPPESPRSYQETLQLAPPAMSICLTGVMSTEGSCSVSRTLADGAKIHGTIRYRVFRPRQLHMHPPPLVVLHGGPGVPCNYLLPLVNVVTDRSIVYYDQLGCGRSSRPEDEEAYSISLSVTDLEVLMKQWKLEQYHFLGHSFGGIVAFEYLKRTNDPKCQSVIISSAPTSVALVEAESQRLLRDLVEEGDDGDKRRALERFRCKHECQALPIPLSLLDAYAQAGKKWRGIQAIPDYIATLEQGESPLSQPAFLIRGQDDFVTQACVVGWSKLFSNTQTMVLAGCSHHGLLENEQLYGDVVSSFLVDHDPSKAQETGERWMLRLF